VKKEDLPNALAYTKTLSVPSGHVSFGAGRNIYTRVCWLCHGLDGKGDGPGAARIKVTPDNLTVEGFSVARREEGRLSQHLRRRGY